MVGGRGREREKGERKIEGEVGQRNKRERDVERKSSRHGGSR